MTSSNPDARQNTLDVLLRTNSLNREDALALLSGELLGVGRALGLDSVRVDSAATTSTPSSRTPVSSPPRTRTRPPGRHAVETGESLTSR